MYALTLFGIHTNTGNAADSDKTSIVHLIKCKKRFLVVKVNILKETLSL